MSIEESNSGFSFPITHCYPKEVIQKLSLIRNVDIEQVNSTSISFCDDLTQCPRRVRTCLEGERPTDQLVFKIAVLSIALHVFSLISAFFLQKLGHYLTMYNWSKFLLSFCDPIIHTRNLSKDNSHLLFLLSIEIINYRNKNIEKLSGSV